MVKVRVCKRISATTSRVLLAPGFVAAPMSIEDTRSSPRLAKRQNPLARVVELILLQTLTFTTSSYSDYYDIYRADYPKGAFCAAIAGSCASDNDPENSFFQNPAAIAPLSVEEGYFIFDGDFNPGGNLEPGMNTGGEISETTFMGGFGYFETTWGAGLAFQGRMASLSTNATLKSTLGEQKISSTTESSTLLINFPFAVKLTSSLSAGASIYITRYSETLGLEGATAKTSDYHKIPTLGFSLGLLCDWKTFRYGSWFRSANSYWVVQEFSLNRLGNNISTSEIIGLHLPWVWSNGISLLPFDDEKTILFDLDLIGMTSEGFQRTLDVFATSDSVSFRKKGRYLTLEPHLAWRSPWWHGSKGTYYLGSYYETPRWEGLSGRLHGTAGISYKIGNVPVLSSIETIAAVDLANDYFSLIFSFR